MRNSIAPLALHLGLLLALLPAPAAAQVDEVAQVDPGLFEHLRFRCVGPTRGGRVTAVTGVPSAPGTFYFGATGGGVWKSEDFGATWRNLSDGSFASPSIGAIAVAPSDPEVLYVGTGSDGLRSNVITGRGVYKSTDGGASWSFVGLRASGHIGAVEIDPQDPERCYVAAIGMAFGPSEERGVFRTRDGGASWERVLFVSETCGAVDLEIHPGAREVLYAATWEAERKPWTIRSGGTQGGIHRSDDGGTSWKKLGGGLPTGLIGKIDLAVSRSAPDLVVALVEAEPGGGLYRSRDRGESWELVSTQRGLLDRPFYYCNVDLDPSDAERLFVSATAMHRSTDGGKSWSLMSTPHGDNHGIWIHPDDPQLAIQCNDGGANVTRDGGRTWSSQDNQPTAELYQVAVDDRHPYWLYAGQQDNSTVRVPSAPVRGYRGGANGGWEAVGGCETGPAVPKPGDPDTVYAACKGRFGVYDARTGQERQYYVGMGNLYGHDPADLPYRFQRVSPICVSPHDPGVIYHGSQYVHRTRDEGRTWETISPDLTAFEPDKQGISGEPITRDITGEEYYSTLYVIEESPLEPGLLWTGANDGPVHVTHDGGAVWLDVTPVELPPGGRVQCIEPSPHDPDKAYVAVYRYLLGDWQPYLYRTRDRGITWTRLTDGTNGIPADTPTRVVREDPAREGLLYAGTEFGLYVSFDDGGNWQPFQLGLPVTPVTDIVVHAKDLVLSTMGRSFWILDDLSALHELRAGPPPRSVTLFAPRAAIRERRPPVRSEELANGIPSFAPAGANLDYYLPAGFDGPLALTIRDERGEVVFSQRAEVPVPSEPVPASTGDATSAEVEPEELAGGDPAERGGMIGPGSGAGFEARRRGPRAVVAALAAAPGMHRFHWDLRGASGLVPPGRYAVQLEAGERSVEVVLEVELDPNLLERGVSAEDVREQAAFLREVSEVVERATTAQRSVEAWAARLEAARPAFPDHELLGPALEEVRALRAELVTASGIAYPQPMLLAQLRYLQSNSARADQAPGNHAYLRLAELRSQLEAIEVRLDRLVAPSAQPERLTAARLFDGVEFLELDVAQEEAKDEELPAPGPDRRGSFFEPPRVVAGVAPSAQELLRARHAALAPCALHWIDSEGVRGFVVLPPAGAPPRAAVFVPGAPGDAEFALDRWQRDHAWFRMLAHAGYAVVGFERELLPELLAPLALGSAVERICAAHPFLNDVPRAWIDDDPAGAEASLAYLAGQGPRFARVALAAPTGASGETSVLPASLLVWYAAGESLTDGVRVRIASGLANGNALQLLEVTREPREARWRASRRALTAFVRPLLEG